MDLERKYVDDSLSLVRSYDPRMDFNEKKRYSVVTGIANILPQINVATGNSISAVSHTFQTSPEFAFDRRMLLKWYVELTITGTSPAGTLLQLGTNDGIRCMPISSMINNAQISFNGQSVSTLLSEYIQALNRYEDEQMSNGWVSTSPSQPDQFQTYSDYTVYGPARNPLARYGANTTQIPRGGHPITVVSDNGTTAVVRFVITEPLRLSPLTWDDFDQPALIGVNQITVQLNLNDFSRFWCHAYSAGYSITAITGSFYQNCELQYNLITPDSSVPISRQKNYFWSYSKIDRYLTNAGSVAQGASSSITCNSITLNAVPSRIYMYLRQRDADLLSTTTAWYNSDNMASIQSLNITFNGVSGLLASASPQQLYLMSVKNGLQLSWPQFNQFVGSPICAAFGSDIGLGNQGLAVGTRGNFQLTVQANFTNPITTSNTTPATTINYDFYVVVMMDGVISSFDSSFTILEGVLTKRDVLEVISQGSQFPYVPYQRVRTLYGKGFFDSIGSFFSDIYHKGLKPIGRSAFEAAKSVLPAVANVALRTAVPEAGPVLDVASALLRNPHGGAIVGGSPVGGAVVGGKRRGRPKGSKNKKTLRGGKIKSIAALKKQLKKSDSSSCSDSDTD